MRLVKDMICKISFGFRMFLLRREANRLSKIYKKNEAIIAELEGLMELAKLELEEEERNLDHDICRKGGMHAL